MSTIQLNSKDFASQTSSAEPVLASTVTGGAGLTRYVAVIGDVKAYNEEGGTAVATTWTPRVLSTEIKDDDSIVSLTTGDNSFTLVAGTFFIEWHAPFFKTQRTTTRLYDLTGTSPIAFGSATYAYTTHDIGISYGAFIVTIGSPNAYRIDYYATNGMADEGLGLAHDVSSTSSIYTMVYIHKI